MWGLVLIAPLAAMVPTSSSYSSAPGLDSSVCVRLAQRRDLLPLSGVVERSFAAPVDGSRTTSFSSSQAYTALDALNTRIRIGLDIERRMTPWDWCRHAQVIAEDRASGRILGFAEVWGEDAESLNNLTAKSPQPVLFNLCVAREARRRGVALALLSKCEEQCLRWGDETLHLKVRDDNPAACALYDGAGYDVIETRPVAELPSWQEQWKGGAVPLRVMRKRLSMPESAADLGREIVPKSLDEFEVTWEAVKGYGDPDAVVWFALLVLRNMSFLTPQYRVLPALAIFAAFGSYLLLVRILSMEPELYEALKTAVVPGG